MSITNPSVSMPALSLAILTLCYATSASASYDCLIEPTKTVDIHSTVVGRLESVAVRRGDTVTKGQVIATLESSAEQAATNLARFKSEMMGPVTAADTKQDYARRKYERRKNMRSDNFMSVQELDEAEGEMRLAEAELMQARENKRHARLEWEQQNSLLQLRKLRSPFTGVVVEQQLHAGEVINPGDDRQPIMRLAQLNPLRVRAILPLSVFGKVKPTMAVTITPESPISGKYTGRVKTVDRVVDAASGTFSVFLELPNPKHLIPAGIKCRVEFPITPAQSKLPR